ncbi:MAG: hypothetical protein DWH78_06635 [Planctomycetota bacterium]|nr:MAG: hypothetical protein DWH78_06635 [Planctomycetota bacterium]
MFPIGIVRPNFGFFVNSSAQVQLSFFQGVLVFGGFRKGEKRRDGILRSDAIKPPKHPIAAALAVSVK